MSNEIFGLLPAYLVLDTSASMGVDGAFEAAFDFLPVLLAEMNRSASVADKLRVEVLTFDAGSEKVFPLGTREQLKHWLDQKTAAPILPEGYRTHYGEAFKLLRTRIEAGIRQIRSEVHREGSYTIHHRAYRPVVFLITDGRPNDDVDGRNREYAALTDPGFAARPNIVCVGVGQAKFDDLKAYGAGRYRSASGSYITGNREMVLVSRDGVAPSAALKAIIPALVQSLVKSMSTAVAPDVETTNTVNSHEDEDMEDPFGELEDIADDEGERLFEKFDRNHR